MTDDRTDAVTTAPVRERSLDLARHHPGRRAGHQAARIRQAGGADRNWRLGADGEHRTAPRSGCSR